MKNITVEKMLILSASRRTDIPAFYSGWFLNRIKEGFVCVRNPVNPRQISKITLSPNAIDCIVFWSKNPTPLLKKIDRLSDYKYYFQFTLNSYSQEIETGLPPKRDRIDTFKKLSDKIGKEKIIWRYDPILLNKEHTIDYHIDFFGEIATSLRDYTEKVTISFVDLYNKNSKNMEFVKNIPITKNCKLKITEIFGKIARENNFLIDTCAEDIDLSSFGIKHALCVDNQLIERITGYPLYITKDKNQRLECGCAQSIDIGAYNSCSNGCLYCYANYSRENVEKNRKNHNLFSPLLIGNISEKDIIRDKKINNCKTIQSDLFK
ncbi:MAG: DUF1848 domain-containing protein [Chitinispirillales bacterium]|jgi:hypothetical protein|nr:DUF1848 domain-containing protein [Chitinispirillales bacterium]